MPRATIGSAPYVSLFLILIVVALVPVSGSKGVPVRIARQVSCGPDDKSLVLAIRWGGSVMSLNSEPPEPIQLESRLREIFETRAERILLVLADNDVPIGMVADMLDRASKIVPVGLLTNSVIEHERSCGVQRVVNGPVS